MKIIWRFFLTLPKIGKSGWDSPKSAGIYKFEVFRVSKLGNT